MSYLDKHSSKGVKIKAFQEYSDACILMFLRHGSGKGTLKCENREMVEEFELQEGFTEFLNQVHGNLVLNCIKLKEFQSIKECVQ